MSLLILCLKGWGVILQTAGSRSELQGQLAEKEPSPPQVRTGSYPSAQVILKDKSRPAEALRPQTTFSGRRNRLR